MTTTTERPAPKAAPRPAALAVGTGSTRAIVRRPLRFPGWLRRHGATLSWILPVLAIVGVVQRVGMTTAPQQIDDEGTYAAQAYAVGHLGALTHYTYWYDHPPLGWIQIAGYAGLTDAWNRYGLAVMAAREAMLFFALVSVLLVWLLARRIGLSRPAAAIGALVMGISPLAIQYHRTVYLDNVAVPWLLLAFLLALSRKNQLAGFVGSAFAFGISVLSKETFLLALPFLAWVMIRQADRSTRRYSLAIAGAVLVLVGSAYVALAAVKGELAPGKGHTSLWTGVTYQLGTRSASGSLFDTHSLFFKGVSQWWNLDPVFIVMALLASIVALFMPRLRPFGALVVFAAAVLFRPNGYVPVPYIIMLIPFGALVIAGVADFAVKTYRHRAATPTRTVSRRTAATVWLAVTSVAIAVAAPLWAHQLKTFTTVNFNAPMVSAENWVDTNVPHESRLLVDDSMWVDLVRDGFARDNVVWFYKIDTDGAIEAQNPNGWKDSDYIIETQSIRSSASGSPDVVAALKNSSVVASFGNGTAEVDVRKIDPQGLTDITATAKSAAAARAAAGAQLATNPNLTADAADMLALRQGRLDARATVVLGQLLATGPVSIGTLSPLAGEQSQTFRQLVITRSAGEPGSALAGWVKAVGPTFAPSTITRTSRGTVLTFPAIEPAGLLG